MSQGVDPDALLQEVTRAQRGKLKIFMGFAPGVGKTYAMLRAAQALRGEGVDVAVGIVETHGRPETETLLRGLEILPRRVLYHQRVAVREMDLDGLLARRPHVALVDELAHSNAPGSRHPKRWQDIEELRDAGIDVWTTLNVQHLESQSDVVSRITGAPVQETIPDHVVQQADAIELIDLPPETLLKRLAEGKVYAPERAQRALAGFFAPGNLTALRELALRAAADRVDDQMLDWRQTHQVDGIWPTRERMMVALDDTPDAQNLVRAAKRSADRQQAPWLAVHVERPGGSQTQGRRHLAAALRLAEQLGGRTLILPGENIAQTLLEAASEHNVSRIILGRGRRIGWHVSPSLADRLVAQGEGFDVLVAGTATKRGDRPRADLTNLGARVLAACLTVAGAAGLAWLAGQAAPRTDAINAMPPVFLMLAVIGGGLRWGTTPAIVAALLAYALLDAAFLRGADQSGLLQSGEVLPLLILLLGGALAGRMSRHLHAQASQRRRHLRQSGLISDCSRSMAMAVDSQAVAWMAVHHAHVLLQTPSVALLHQHGMLQRTASMPAMGALDTASTAAAQWSWQHGQPAGHDSDTLPGAPWLFLPLSSGEVIFGVLGARFDGLDTTDDIDRAHRMELLDTIAQQTGGALERLALSEAAARAHIKAENEHLHAAWLASIGQDLMRPCLFLRDMAGQLRDMWPTLADEARRTLLDGVCAQAQRIAHFMQNFQDMAALVAGQVTPQAGRHDLATLVTSALSKQSDMTQGRAIRLDIPAHLPVLAVDADLTVKALEHIIENACLYAPPDTPIILRASEDGPGHLRLDILDEGPGIPENERERIFAMFTRLARPEDGQQGTGLGLAICRALIESQGGTIAALSGPDSHGTCIRLCLPIAAMPSSNVMTDATNTQGRPE